MAEVWSVEGAPDIAVKLLSIAAARVPRLVRAVRTEVRVAAGLYHPNIVGILDTGELRQDGISLPWIALERASHSLAEAPGVEILEVLRHVLSGLAHAQAHGVLHRDVKPGNVLRLGDRWVLSDFGLASSERSEVLRGGSPGYAAPEQIRGAVWEEGPWTDLYAVGALAWALCTGQAPAMPSDLESGTVPEGLAAWVTRATHYRAEHRFLHAAEALAALPDSLDIAARTTLASARSESSTQYFLDADIPESPSDIVAAPIPTLQVPPLPAVAPPDAVPTAVARSVAALVPPPIPGQEQARAALWTGLREAERGRRRVVLLSGAPGSGRHALLSRVLAQADELGSACVIRMRASPTRPVGADDLAREALGAMDSSREEAERIASHWGIDDPALVELIDPRLPRVRLHTVSATTASLGRALEAKARGRVIAIAVEEAQHSPDLLFMAAEHLQALPERTLVVFSTSEGGSAPARALLGRLGHPTPLRPIAFENDATLRPWQDALDAHLGLPEPGERLSTLSPAALGALEVAAILGRDVDEDLWLEVCAATQRTDPRDTLPELLAGSWLEREGRDRWLFRSEVLSDTVLAQLGPDERRALHAASAQALAARPPSQARAEHLLAIGDRLEGARVWYRAHEGHTDLRALALAELEERVAVEPPDLVCVLVLAMRVHTAAMADSDTHDALLSRLRDAVAATADPIGTALVAFAVGWRAATQKTPQIAAIAASRTLVDLPEGIDAYWARSQFTLLQADILAKLGRLPEAIEMARLAQTHADHDTHWTNAGLHLAHYHLMASELEEAIAILDAVGGRTQAMSGSMQSVVHQIRGFIAEEQGDIEEAERQTRASIEVRDQMQMSAPHGRVNHAVYLTQLGRLDEARARLAEVPPTQWTDASSVFAIQLVWATADGDLERVRQLLDAPPAELSTDLEPLVQMALQNLDGPELAAQIRAIPIAEHR